MLLRRVSVVCEKFVIELTEISAHTYLAKISWNQVFTNELNSLNSTFDEIFRRNLPNDWNTKNFSYLFRLWKFAITDVWTWLELNELSRSLTVINSTSEIHIIFHWTFELKSEIKTFHRVFQCRHSSFWFLLQKTRNFYTDCCCALKTELRLHRTENCRIAVENLKPAWWVLTFKFRAKCPF